ncbi:electron transporter SenC [Shewanella algidipiscicola]|uniref:Electron transporter SenC n=1 Tax=Shewanella algidipiscicola TaxID=614070 RepID=A0ABQ4PC13_9GAMM|nr:SCO family protein [Shewanella algidipiscicola]GIU45075.1 electron transporter SenC [Shewanella algidipiscicola]
MKKIVLLGILLVCATLGAITAYTLNQTATPPLSLTTSYLYPTKRPLSQFNLVDQHGQAFTNQHLLHKWSLVFVGYTSCPDVCPTTMAKLAAAVQSLPPELDLQVIFLSVDPSRDTPDKLLDYVNFFNSDFIAVTAPHAQLLPLTRELGFVYAMVGEGENYQVDHSASMTLISPQGERYATVKPKLTQLSSLPQISTQNLVADLQQLTANDTL